MWMTLALAGLSIRSDLAGVTSLVRALGLITPAYKALLHMFHSQSLSIDKVTDLWCQLVLKLFTPFRISGRLVLIGDGIKVSKEGNKMPAVKKLHQESANNSKPTYIFGHSFQCLGLLVKGPLGKLFSVPLISRIHEGVVFTNRDKRTLLDKFANLFVLSAGFLKEKSCFLVADSYYSSRKVIKPMLDAGHHLITRAKKNAVAYVPAEIPKKRKVGRPKFYGDKKCLRDFWKKQDNFLTVSSPVYGEKNVSLKYYSMDLLWRPIAHLVRFVLVDHPNRGKMILMSTDCSLDPIDIITLYGHRFKIEVAFKQSLYTIGCYHYHFWMRDMKPIKRISGNQYLHRTSDNYRRLVRRKIEAYHRYVQLGCITQGLLQYLSLNFRVQVWKKFGSWMRTMKLEQAPSEAVVAQSLRNCLPEFLADNDHNQELKKFIMDKVDPDRCPALVLAA
jgi:hypothetical protein